MASARSRAFGVISSILQVILLSLSCSLNLIISAMGRARRRRRNLQRQLTSDSFRHVRHRSQRVLAGRCRHQKWYMVAGTRYPRRYWIYPRSSDWWANFVLKIWSDEQWMMNFRMTRSTFDGILEALRPSLEKKTTNIRSPVPADQRLAVTIWYLANRDTYREVSNQFGLGVSTVGEIVLEVCSCIVKELHSSIVCLGNGFGQVMDAFGQKGISHCIGAVDGTHIPIRAPGGRIEEYGNRKKFCSVLLQGTVDSSGRFFDAVVGHPGRTNDALVFTSSNLCSAMDAGLYVPGNPTININGVAVPAMILGDGAYPMRRWLLTPYRTPSTSIEKFFNKRQSSARNVVERAFGRLKSRWRVLSSRMDVSIDSVNRIIISAVVLHNICEERGHEICVEEPDTFLIPDVDFTDAREQGNRNLEEGKVVRDAIAQYIYERRR